MVIAGWTGRDVAALEHHIEELKAIGVQPPSKVPLYYRVAASLLTQAEAIQVVGDDTSGEAEPVLVGTADRLWVTVGADHTDRKLETYGVAQSKQVCPKVIGRSAWRFEDVEPHWDQLILRSFIEQAGKKVPYQEGLLAKIAHAARSHRRLAPRRQAPAGRRGDVLRHPAGDRRHPVLVALRHGDRGPGAGPQARALLHRAGVAHHLLSGRLLSDEVDDGAHDDRIGQQTIVAKAARHHQLRAGQRVGVSGRFEDGDLPVVLVVDQEQRQVDLAGDAADVEVRRRPADMGLNRGNEGSRTAFGEADGRAANRLSSRFSDDGAEINATRLAPPVWATE